MDGSNARTKRGALILFGALSTLAGTNPPVSEANSAAIYYEGDTDELMLSENGDPYSPFASLASGGWTRTSGVISESTPSDRVDIGAAGAAATTAEMFLWSQDATIPFAIGNAQSNNASAPHNQVQNLGWNIGRDGLRIVAGEPAIYFSIESNFLTGGQRYVEMHWQYISDDGATTCRPVTIAINRATDVVGLGLYASNHQFGSADGLTVYWDLSSTAAGTLTSHNAAGNYIYFTGQGRTLLAADKTAAVGTPVELLRVSSAVGHGDDTVYWDLNRNWPRFYISSPETAFLPNGLVHVTISAVAGAHRLGFFGVAAAVQQVSGANLTNNVTAGGVDNTVADIVAAAGEATAADLTTTRNAVYQIARKLKQLNDGARLYGLFT